MLLNERLDAAGARARLVTRVVADDALDAEAERSRPARGRADRRARRGQAAAARLGDPRCRQLAEEARDRRRAAPDGREGVAAFLEKRAPRFDA